MSEVIKILPTEVAGQIAAGEIVNRPASVVKELVENAIDAGSTNVQVLLTDAGRTSIQVIDNGFGMSSADSSLCFERHATSKIRTSDDLYSLTTFGFRGEALASIASVSEVELRTRQQSDEIGTSLIISASEIVSQEPVACPSGCNFIVKNLFFNVPARRKFLKNNQTEFGHVLTEIERVALVHPEVSISLFHQGEEIVSLPVSSLKQRIIGLFGKKMNQILLPVEVHTSVVDITGFCGTLDSTRKHGAEQFFFVNGRYMRHPYFHKAVMNAYEKLIPEGEQPTYILFLDVPKNSIDVNIHPSKTEIKFAEEPVIWKIILSAVSEAIGKFEEMPKIDFDTQDMPDIPVFDGNKNINQPKVSYNPNFNPFSSSPSYRERKNESQWTKLIGEELERKLNDSSSPASYYQSKMEKAESFEPIEEKFPCFQYQNRFIITSTASGLMIIDQHRAHVRILFERYKVQLKSGDVASQGLLFPEMFHLSISDASLFQNLKEDFAALGFDISDMGHGAVAVQSVPAGLENMDYEKLIVDMIAASRENGTESSDSQREKMAQSMAEKAAIKNGKALTADEMNEIISSLKSCEMPSRTPEGKTVYILQSPDALDRMF